MSGKFDLKDYIDVKTRVAEFYQRYPDGRLVTEQAFGTTEPDDVPRVWVKALAYRTADDPHPGTGWSWMVLPGSTPYTRGSEIENAETSAWGRAIGALGIGIAGSIASRDEVQAKAGDEVIEDARRLAAVPDPADGLIGTVEERKPPADLSLRVTPDGPIFGFGLVAPGRGGRVQVMAEGAMAEALAAAGLKVGERVTVWGHTELVEWTPKGGTAVRTYPRLHLSRIETADWTLPSRDDDLSDLDFPAEAQSVPLFPEGA